MSDTSNVAPLRVPGFAPRRNGASQNLKNKLATELKALRVSRDVLLGEIYERKARLDDVDMSIDTLANSISRIDREALLSTSPDDVT